jgi:hypothetical protein
MYELDLFLETEKFYFENTWKPNTIQCKSL